jgi:hypothetical protein
MYKAAGKMIISYILIVRFIDGNTRNAEMRR